MMLVAGRTAGAQRRFGSDDLGVDDLGELWSTNVHRQQRSTSTEPSRYYRAMSCYFLVIVIRNVLIIAIPSVT